MAARGLWPGGDPSPAFRAERRVRYAGGTGDSKGVAAVSAQLTVRGLRKQFGGLVALNRVDLAFDEGELAGLIGPNGSGKTTLLNVISGYYAPNAGSVHFAGRRIDGLAPSRLARLGIGRSFQVTKSSSG